MPRPSKFEIHEDGPTLERLLIEGKITGAEVARKLGITESAVSQHLAKLKDQVKKKTAEKLAEKDPILEQQAQFQVDELAFLQRNIHRLEELIEPLHSYLTGEVENPPDMDKGLVSLTRSLFTEVTRSLETLKKIKGELAPEIQVIQINQFRQQVQAITQFLVQQHPELLEEYEQFLQEGRE